MEHMQPLALVFLGAVWALVIGCTVWSFYKMTTTNRDLGGPS